MQLTHTKPREDLNDGQPHTAKQPSALQTMHRLHLALGKGPIKTAPRRIR